MQTAKYRIISKAEPAEVEVKKSRFICALKNVRTEAEAAAFLEEIRKSNRDARHNCFAFRLGTPENVLERFSDDGEPQGTAGKPMLAILQGAGLYDVCAVVTRYFGGTLLGTGGLLRAYSDSLKAGLEASEEADVLSGYRAELSVDYTFAGKIKYAVEQCGVFTENEEYTDKIRFTWLIPEDNAESFKARITEICMGKAVFENEMKAVYYGGSRPQIYAVSG